MLSGLKLAGMIVVVKGFSGCSKTRTTGKQESSATGGSRILAQRSFVFSQKFTKTPTKTGGQPC
jgi:hypothetical protein